MKLINNYKFTVFGSYVGYLVQGVILSFLPLLYVQFNKEFSISYDVISVVISITFLLQLCIDYFAAKFVDRIGYRKCLVASCIFSTIGLALLGILPYYINPVAGIIIAVVFYSTGCGLIEVLVSPLVESCPTKNKTAHMCLLHSFYCWGLLFTVLVSTAFFAVFGIENWRWLAICWAFLPFVNTFIFLFCPIYKQTETSEGTSIKQLLKNKTVWLIIILMLLGGSAEVSISQWMSVFVEQGLGIPKDYCDLLGTCIFAACMGISRVVFGLLSSKISLKKILLGAAAVTIAGYLLIGFSPNAVLSIIGCALCGFSTALLWPATLSLGAQIMPDTGTSLFGLMALGGDAGCIIGPALVGFVAAKSSVSTGILSGIGCPIALFVIYLLMVLKKTPNSSEKEKLPLES